MSSNIVQLTHRATSAMVAVHCRVPEGAVSASLLGTERNGHGVRIRADGLIVTAGYLVIEAEQIWLTSRDGNGSPGYVIAQDYDSGLALLKPTIPLGNEFLPPASHDGISIGEALHIACSDEKVLRGCKLIAVQEFAGRWEYLVDEALFTAPVCENWAGAGLINDSGQLFGIGSLLLEFPLSGTEMSIDGNMFIPVDLVAPFLDEMCKYGMRNIPARPWLGALVQEYEGKLVIVGVYRDCPADRAGIQPGEIIVSVNDEPVTSLAELFRKVWSLGSAGVEVPLTISGSDKVRRCCLQSIDRATIFQQPHSAPLN